MEGVRGGEVCGEGVADGVGWGGWAEELEETAYYVVVDVVKGTLEAVGAVPCFDDGGDEFDHGVVEVRVMVGVKLYEIGFALGHEGGSEVSAD